MVYWISVTMLKEWISVKEKAKQHNALFGLFANSNVALTSFYHSFAAAALCAFP